jgi:shikimate kinase
VKNHVILVGMMGSGKTTVGRLVAERLGCPFIDSDEQVEARAGRTVRQIWEQDGEPAFRAIESEALSEALASDVPSVIASGGGVVLDPANRAAITTGGRVVWLHTTPKVLATRVGPGGHRPLLGPDPLAALTVLLEERTMLYGAVANVVVEVGDTDVEGVVDRVLEAAA